MDSILAGLIVSFFTYVKQFIDLGGLNNEIARLLFFLILILFCLIIYILGRERNNLRNISLDKDIR